MILIDIKPPPVSKADTPFISPTKIYDFSAPDKGGGNFKKYQFFSKKIGKQKTTNLVVFFATVGGLFHAGFYNLAIGTDHFRTNTAFDF